jgi:hypothetical protein
MTRPYFSKPQTARSSVSVGTFTVSIVARADRYSCGVTQAKRQRGFFWFSRAPELHLAEILSRLKTKGVVVSAVKTSKPKVTARGEVNTRSLDVILRQLTALTGLARQLESPHAEKIAIVLEALNKFSAEEARRRAPAATSMLPPSGAPRFRPIRR